MSFPAAFDHAPVRLVAVHRYLHAAAAGSYPGVEAGRVKRSEEFLKRIDIFKRRSLPDVAAVEQDVHSDFLYSFFLRLRDHRLKVVDVRMDVAVREKADKMKRGVVFDGV